MNIIFMILALITMWLFIERGLWNPNSKIHKDPALSFMTGMLVGACFVSAILI